jgi:peroxiredoxin
LHQHFTGEPFVLLGIDIQESREKVQWYLQEHGITYPNLLDEEGQVSLLYGVRSTPMKFLIDKEGNVIGAALGYNKWDTDEVKRLIEALMRQ